MPEAKKAHAKPTREAALESLASSKPVSEASTKTMREALSLLKEQQLHQKQMIAELKRAQNERFPFFVRHSECGQPGIFLDGDPKGRVMLPEHWWSLYKDQGDPWPYDFVFCQFCWHGREGNPIYRLAVAMTPVRGKLGLTNQWAFRIGPYGRLVGKWDREARPEREVSRA